MKIRLLIVAVLFSVLSFGQTPTLVIKLNGPTTEFGQNIPVGTILVDMTANKEYLTLLPLLSTNKLNDCLPLSSGKIKEISNSTHTGGDVNGTANSDVLTIGTDKVLTSMIKDGEVQTNDIKDNNVTYAKIQQVGSQRLIGNSGNATANASEISTANGLTLSGGVLSGSGGTVTSVSIVPANGVTGSVATATATKTPAITLTLWDITPTNITTTGTITANGKVKGSQLEASNTSGAPFVVHSTTAVSGLNIGGNAATADVATTANSASNLKGGNAGRIPYQTDIDNTSFIPNGTKGQVLTSDGSNVPVWKSVSILPVVNITTPGGLYNWDLDTGVNGRITLAGDTKIKLINPADGASGKLTVYNPDNHQLELDYGVIGDVVYGKTIFTTTGTQVVKTSPPAAPGDPAVYDVYSWYFDGVKVFWDGELGFTY